MGAGQVILLAGPAGFIKQPMRSHCAFGSGASLFNQSTEFGVRIIQPQSGFELPQRLVEPATGEVIARPEVTSDVTWRP